MPCISFRSIRSHLLWWRGNPPPLEDSSLSRKEFSVLGAEDADPIGLEVLTEACAAAQACGASYLWLDRLCIMQDSRQDKQWQVREMYRIYTFSTVCLVAPGGLRQLVPLSEETQWIHRSWTLQEVVAPPSVAVLFAWTHGSGTAHAKFQGEKTRARIEIVTSKTSAMLELGEVLDLCCVGYFEFTPDAEETTLSLRIETALLGKAPADVPKGKVLTDIRLPNVASLSFAAEVGSYMDTEDIRDACIWQCALVRTSSRPVDMVFSIMGILGVTLDSSEFEVDDRLGATIALAREILRQGRSASWLGMSAYLPPCPYLSTFPTFPRTSVAGKAMYNLPGGGQHSATLVDAIYPIDVGRFPILKGSMDEKGYHSFDAGAIKVIATSPAATMSTDSLYDDASRPAKLRALDGLVWMVGSDWPTSDSCDSPDFQLTQEPQSFAVIIGVFNGMFAVTMGDIIRAMLVTEHAKDRYHVRSYFLLNHEAMEWAASWKTRHFCVGGPATPSK